MAVSRSAPWLLLAASGSLLLGALGFQYLGGLAPCEMCHWQRYAHLAVVLLAAAVLVTRVRAFTLLAIIAMAVSAALGLYHAGVEQQWWEGVTACSSPVQAGMTNAELLASLMAAPLVRCDTIPWSLLGISMAGWNAILSALAMLAALWLWRRT